MMRLRPSRCAAFAALVLTPRTLQQPTADIAPVAPSIVRTYETGPDGLELFRVNHVVIEPASGALWVHYGEESEPPVRIDRRTGAAKVIGRRGSGPNEYTRIIAMVPGAHGDVGIWDPGRRLWFWVDSAGVQRRTWPLPTNSLNYGQIFSDARGNVYIGQPLAFADPQRRVAAVRVDSAAGLRDTIPIPFQTDSKWQWSASTANGSSGTRVMHAPSVVWSVDARGRLLVAWTDSNFVTVRDGGRDRRVLVPNYREPLSAQERRRATESLDQFEATARSRSAQLSGPRPSLPEFRNQLTTIVPDMTGGFALPRLRVCRNIPEWRAPGTREPAPTPDGRCGIVERFDAEGRRLRPFTLQAGHQLRVMRGDTAWVVSSNRDGFDQILEMVVPR